MTEETKKLIKKATIGYYVAKFMNVATTRLLYDRKYDIRKVKEAKFDGLVFEEHLVPSDYDDYKISVLMEVGSITGFVDRIMRQCRILPD
jgi:hypothetical protein